MNNYTFDNEGSGFNIEDDEDLESMLGRASAASEDDGDLNIRPSKDEPQELTFDEEPEPAPAPAPTFEFDDEPAPAPVLDFDEPAETEPEPTPAPVPTPTVIAEKPAAPQKATRTKMHVPTEAEQISDIARTISILDAYRSLSREEKAVAIQFVTTGEMDSAEDAVVVAKVLNADPMLVTTMRALREAHECDAVERAFYAMGLETKVLHSLGSLVAVFSEEEYDESLTNLEYSRRVVAGIAELGDREIMYVKATESVLAAAETAQA